MLYIWTSYLYLSSMVLTPLKRTSGRFYTIQRPVLFVTNRAMVASERAFVDYIFSDIGRAIVVENGYIPAY